MLRLPIKAGLPVVAVPRQPESCLEWPEEGVRVAVKNTFVTIEPVERSEVWRRGAQTCVARFSESSEDPFCLKDMYEFSDSLSSTEESTPESRQASIWSDADEWEYFESNREARAESVDHVDTPPPSPRNGQDTFFSTVMPDCYVQQSMWPLAYVDCVVGVAIPPPPYYAAPITLEEGGVAFAQSTPPATEALCDFKSPEPSVGSAAHGTTTIDGLPGCQPCAWFYKDSGCQNAATCLYCHMCPAGELKTRKKKKVALMRKQEQDQRAQAQPQQEQQHGQEQQAQQ